MATNDVVKPKPNNALTAYIFGLGLLALFVYNTPITLSSNILMLINVVLFTGIYLDHRRTPPKEAEVDVNTPNSTLRTSS